MKVLNTVPGNPLVAELNRKILSTPADRQPSTAAASLCRRMLGHLRPLRTLGAPVFQLFGQSQPFLYGGKTFELDVAWTHPDGAIDGVCASFLVVCGGGWLQFILFDQRCGTVFEKRLGAGDLGTRLPSLVRTILLYCSRRP